MGEHGLIDKRFPYAQSVKVPWPGHVNPGTRWPRLVGLLGIAPTILDATGTPYDRAQVDGRDLVGHFRRDRMHLEYWRSNGAPGIPGWRGARGRPELRRRRLPVGVGAARSTGGAGGRLPGHHRLRPP